MEEEEDQGEEESIKGLLPKTANNKRIENKRNFDTDVIPTDMLDELMKYHAQELKAIEDCAKMSDLQKEINKVNELEAKLVRKLQQI